MIGKKRSNAKYIDRIWKNGRWNYIYDNPLKKAAGQVKAKVTLAKQNAAGKKLVNSGSMYKVKVKKTKINKYLNSPKGAVGLAKGKYALAKQNAAGKKLANAGAAVNITPKTKKVKVNKYANSLKGLTGLAKGKYALAKQNRAASKGMNAKANKAKAKKRQDAINEFKNDVQAVKTKVGTAVKKAGRATGKAYMIGRHKANRAIRGTGKKIDKGIRAAGQATKKAYVENVPASTRRKLHSAYRTVNPRKPGAGKPNKVENVNDYKKFNRTLNEYKKTKNQTKTQRDWEDYVLNERKEYNKRKKRR